MEEGLFELAWITNGYILTVGCSMLAAGTLADFLGRKRVFMFGLTTFTALSAILGAVDSATWLAILRTLQGAAGAAILAGGTALLAHAYQGQGRRKALSWIGTSFGVGLALGPPVAGLLIDLIGWRSIFFASALVGTIAMAIGTGQLVESKDPHATRIDRSGILTISASLCFMTWAIMQAPIVGWTHASTLGYVAGSIVFLAVFTRLQVKSPRPMLDVTLFREPRFVAVQSLPIATTCCYVVLLLVLPIRLVSIEGMSSMHAGMAVFFLSLPLMVVPRFAARLVKHMTPGALSTLGLVVASIGLSLLSLRSAHDGLITLAIPLIVIGIGTGLPWGLMDGLAVSVVTVERAGMAAGIFNTMRLASEAVGLALVGALLALLISLKLPDQAGSDVAFRLAVGDLQGVLSEMPVLHRAGLVALYDDAFSQMLRILALATLAFAGFVHVFLGGEEMEKSCNSV
ncbi:MFS transporter [Pseudomonas sp. PhalM4]